MTRAQLLAEIKRLTAIILARKSSFVKYPDKLRPLVQRKADQLVKEMEILGLPIRIVEGIRSCDLQNKYYAQGRNGDPRPIITNAKCGDSLHQYGVAFDVVFRVKGYNATEAEWQKLGNTGKKIGLEWGGDWRSFPDKPHFQMMLNYTLDDFKHDRVDYKRYT